MYKLQKYTSLNAAAPGDFKAIRMTLDNNNNNNNHKNKNILKLAFFVHYVANITNTYRKTPRIGLFTRSSIQAHNMSSEFH